MSCETGANPWGTSVGGPPRVAWEPTSRSACTSDRATRECVTSPTIATCRPSRRPTASRSVYRASSAWVGWGGACLVQRVQVEQRLGRMLVLPVAGVDDARLCVARDDVRRPCFRMAHDD